MTVKLFTTKFITGVVFGLLLTGSIATVPAASVTFRVNMAGQMVLGRFNPANGDTVVVSGDTLNNWNSTGFLLTISPYNTNIYVGTFTISDRTSVYYKYAIKSGGGVYRWESNNNRVFGVTTGAQTVPISFFGNYLGYIVGADMSQVNYETNWFHYNVNGRVEDPFVLLREKGFNAVRLRLWTSSAQQAQTNKDGSINNLTYVTPEAAQAKAAGLQILLDLPYSDGWSTGDVPDDMPAAWKNLTFPQLLDQMRRWNSNSIATLKAAGGMPDFVQVGNELYGGNFLSPWGDVGGANDTPTQWSQLGQLMKAAIQGIQDASGPTNMPVIVIHCGEPNQWFFDHLIQQGVPFDVIAQSFYENQRNWPPGESITNTDSRSLSGNATAMLSLYNKAQLVAETSFSQSTNGWAGGPTNWLGIPASPSGQVQYVLALSNAVQNVPYGQTPGVFWWGTEYCGYSWFPATWGGLFNNVGNALPALDALGLLPAAFVRPFAPANVKTTVGNGQVSLRWTPDGATSYNVKRSTISGGPYAAIGTASGTNYTDPGGFLAGTTYYYVVSGVSPAGQGANSLEAAATPVPPVTLGFKNINGGQIQLQWPTGVLLEATNLLGPWMTNMSASPPSYNVVPAEPQMFYRVRVQ